MITDEEPEIRVPVHLSQGTILSRNAKLIDGRVEMLKSARLLTPKRGMPGVLKKLPIRHPG
jgi:hypothetical protein